MNGTRNGNRMYFGWWMVAAAAVGVSFSYGAIIPSVFGVFLKPIAGEFGWSRSQISSAFSLGLLATALVLPLVGRVVDRVGARRVLLVSMCLFALGLGALTLVKSLWQFYACYAFIGFIGAGTSMLPYARVISSWFDARRGLALGLTTVGVGMGAFVMPALAHYLIVATGWRGAFAWLGVSVVVIAVPVIGLMLKETPESVGRKPHGHLHESNAVGDAAPVQQGVELGQATRNPAFWIMSTVFFLVSVSVFGLIAHLVPMLTDRGISAQRAAFLASVFGGTTAVARVAAGYLLDRFFAPRVAALLYLGAALGVSMFWIGVDGWQLLVAIVLVGLAWGAEGDVMPYLVTRYFGLRSFGGIYGYVFGAYILGGVVGPMLMGVGFDYAGTYRWPLGASVIIVAAAAVLMTRLGPYRAAAVN